MELFLLRHGHSNSNQQKLVTGTPEDTLSAHGIIQAKNVSHLLTHYNLNTKYISTYVSQWKRAQQTLELAYPECTPIIDTRLGETNAGSVANLPLTEFNQMHPEFWSDFKSTRPYPEGESHQDLFDRTLHWFHEYEQSAKQGSRTLAITHGGPICCILQAICKVPMQDFPMFLAANASLTKLERQNCGKWRLSFFSMEYK